MMFTIEDYEDAAKIIDNNQHLNLLALITVAIDIARETIPLEKIATFLELTTMEFIEEHDICEGCENRSCEEIEQPKYLN